MFGAEHGIPNVGNGVLLEMPELAGHNEKPTNQQQRNTDSFARTNPKNREKWAGGYVISGTILDMIPQNPA
ncbi:hypothetical protein NQ024_05645 [Corynebacterium sp. 35RC1]|nr:hypothetical protein [Corynebacterium sp. 35RC1]